MVDRSSARHKRGDVMIDGLTNNIPIGVQMSTVFEGCSCQISFKTCPLSYSSWKPVDKKVPLFLSSIRMTTAEHRVQKNALCVHQLVPAEVVFLSPIATHRHQVSVLLSARRHLRLISVLHPYK